MFVYNNIKWCVVKHQSLSHWYDHHVSVRIRLGFLGAHEKHFIIASNERVKKGKISVSSLCSFNHHCHIANCFTHVQFALLQLTRTQCNTGGRNDIMICFYFYCHKHHNIYMVFSGKTTNFNNLLSATEQFREDVSRRLNRLNRNNWQRTV